MTENKTDKTQNYYENIKMSCGEPWFRLVVHRGSDNKSFIEGTMDEESVSKKRTKHNYVLCELSDKQLIELRDYLNSVVL